MNQVKFQDVAIPTILYLISVIFIIPELEETYDFKYFNALFIALIILFYGFYMRISRRGDG